MTKISKSVIVILAVLVLLLLTALVFTVIKNIENYNTAVDNSNIANYLYSMNETNIIDRVNQERGKAGLQPLTEDPVLSGTAQEKNRDMVLNNEFEHIVNGKRIVDKIKIVKPSCKESGENLAVTNQGVDAVINGWLQSESHRKNMLDPRYKTTGLSVTYYGDAKTLKGATPTGFADSTYLVTQHFCSN